MATKAAITTHDDHDHDHDHDHEEGGSMDTLMKLKIALIVILFFIVYLGLIPAYSKFFRNSKVVLSMMNSFAGGVFLAMAFIHILPESVEQYNEAMKEPEEPAAAAATVATKNSTAAAVVDEHDHEEHGAHVFPLPYLLFFVGYMMVLLIDRVLAGEHGHSHGAGGHSDHEHEHVEKELGSTDRKLVISPDTEKSPSKKNGDDIHKDNMVVQDIGNDFD